MISTGTCPYTWSKVADVVGGGCPLRRTRKQTHVSATIDMKRAAPPRPAPRPIARELDGCARLLLLGIADVVVTEVEVETLEVEGAGTVVDTEEENEVGDASTVDVLRKKMPCPLWQHEELAASQQDI
jgi:hypothetical protein